MKTKRCGYHLTKSNSGNSCRVDLDFGHTFYHFPGCLQSKGGRGSKCKSICCQPSVPLSGAIWKLRNHASHTRVPKERQQMDHLSELWLYHKIQILYFRHNIMPIHKQVFLFFKWRTEGKKEKLGVDLRLNLSNRKERKNESSSVNERVRKDVQSWAHGALGGGRGLAAVEPCPNSPARGAELTDVLSDQGKMASTFDFTCNLSLGFISSYSFGGPLWFWALLENRSTVK